MADAEKEKQEKLAAARKRVSMLPKHIGAISNCLIQVEALKKQKGKKAGERTDKKKDEFKSSDKETKIPEGKYDPAGSPADAAPEDNILNVEESESKVGADDDLKTNDDAIETEANDTKPASNQDQTPSTPRASHGRQSSLSIQSKMRSSSFRHASGSGPNIPTSPIVATGLAPLSPKSDSMSEIYRKQAARLEELERENKRLTKDLDTSENRWRKAEEELEELRSNSAQIAELKTRAERSEGKAEEVEKLVRSILDSLNPYINCNRTLNYNLSGGRTLIYSLCHLNLVILQHLPAYHQPQLLVQQITPLS